MIRTDPERRAMLIALEREIGRRSFRDFVRMAWPVVEPNPLRWSWHMDAVCEHLEAVSRGQIRDLVICLPPGLSKSLLVSTFWPAWDWIEVVTRRLITSTYGQELSEKNAKLHRDLVQSEWYQERWPHVKIGKDDVAKVRQFQNTAGGWRFSTSVGGPATGRHGDVLLFDDLVKAQDAEGRAAVDGLAIEKANDFWFKTMATRRADAINTRRVGIAQRLHHEDTPGKCIERGYTALVLPMEFDPARRCVTSLPWSDPRTEPGELLAPDRFPREVVDADRVTLGPLTFEAQAQQNPTPQEGAILNPHLRWTEVPKDARIIITLDCSFKATRQSDFVAAQAWGVKGPHYYLIDEEHGRAKVRGAAEMVLRLLERNPRAIGVYVEDKANGPAVIEALSEHVSGLHEWTPTGDKIQRAEAVAPLFAHNVWIPPDSVAPWIGAWLSEVRKFPLAKHDDRVDACTMALLILHKPMIRKYAEAVAAMRKG